MLKILLAIFCIALGASIGAYKSIRYKKRVSELSKIELFLLRLKTYFSLDKIKTDRIFSSLASVQTFNELDFVKRTSENLKNDPDFKVSFTKALDDSKIEMALKEDDYKPLFNLSDIIGSYDSETVLKEIMLSQELIKQQKDDAEAEYQKNGKLYRLLFTLFGVAVAILII